MELISSLMMTITTKAILVGNSYSAVLVGPDDYLGNFPR
jgi:hypothetical protein